MALPYGAEELEGSPVVQFDEDGATARRIFRVPSWDDWPRFAQELLGRYIVVGGAVHFIPPVSFPGLPGVIVEEMTVEPMDPARPVGDTSSLERGTNRYPHAGARLEVRYRSIFDTDSDQPPGKPSIPRGTYLTFEADLDAKWETTPGRNWVWDVSGAPPVAEDVGPGMLVPSGAFTLTWHRVMRPPWNAIRGLRGKVNSSPFCGASPGTVLFLGAKLRRQFRLVDDSGFWRIRYAFAESGKKLKDQVTPAGWNHFFRRSASAGEENWTLIKAANSSPPERPYQSGDLHALFQFG